MIWGTLSRSYQSRGMYYEGGATIVIYNSSIVITRIRGAIAQMLRRFVLFLYNSSSQFNTLGEAQLQDGLRRQKFGEKELNTHLPESWRVFCVIDLDLGALRILVGGNFLVVAAAWVLWSLKVFKIILTWEAAAL